MGKLCIYLTPFASDYSGVCSALFDMNCLTVINDADCCTSHFVYYDEPRWTKVKRPTLSTHLRTTDAIFGNDKKVVDSVLNAVGEVETDLIAVVGTPVPAMTGMDMEGIACEIEAGCGRPSLGFDTTGYDYYDKGIFYAGKVLIDRFCGKAPDERRGVNILGMTPLDYGDNGNNTELEAALRKAGIEINASLFFNSSLEDVRRLPGAEINLAVSAAGLLIAKKLKKKCGTPYIAAAPMGKKYTDTVIRRLKGEETEKPEIGSGKKLLLIGDQVMMHSLREALALAGSGADMSIGSFFSCDRELEREGDVRITSERHLTEVMKSRVFDKVICDPHVARLPEIKKRDHVTLVHPAVSSRIEWENTPRYLSGDFDRWLAKTAAWTDSE